MPSKSNKETEPSSLNVARVERSREDARKFYDRISRWYDLLSAGSEAKLHHLLH